MSPGRGYHPDHTGLGHETQKCRYNPYHKCDTTEKAICIVRQAEGAILNIIPKKTQCDIVCKFKIDITDAKICVAKNIG